jgi:hypothetical protein
MAGINVAAREAPFALSRQAVRRRSRYSPCQSLFAIHLKVSAPIAVRQWVMCNLMEFC